MAESRSLQGNVLLVGAGKMGGALLEGWLSHGLSPANIAVLDPAPSSDMATFLKEQKIERMPRPGAFMPDAVVVAVKPQVAGEVVPKIAAFLRPKTLVISIMAGRTLASLEKDLPSGSLVARGMPNTPASIGQGITVAVANHYVCTGTKMYATELLSAVGAVEWIEDEALMDAVTAVSGSGPAYVFLLAEALAKAGVDAGLPPELATKLARETVSGSGELLRRSSLDAAKLRENVTSPGGTTAAALEVLMGKDGFQSLLQRAVAAATKRSHDLAN
ncbi:MAG TPA: pyrroline-5-carboxylate reductase [Xanthobacteraceae bacterium]|nr:pyrroline-5-carboxylate reductase [Xanthobacteraceae bacterium]